MLVVLSKRSQGANRIVYKASSMFGPAYDRDSALYKNKKVHEMHIYHQVTLNRKKAFLYRALSGEGETIESDFELAEFYNNLLNEDVEENYYPLMNLEERKLFRGLGKGILCTLMKSYDIADNKDAIVVLEAYGVDPRKDDMMDLVRMYEKLSFETIGGDSQEYINQDLEVPMKTTVGALLSACENNSIRKLFDEGDIGVIVQ